jgi:hypothetical protein
MRRPADIRKLVSRARKVAEVSRKAGPTGAAFAEMIESLVAVIEELQAELADERRRSFYESVRTKK